MTDPASDAALSAASVYENLFVPAEFQEWAPRMVAAARIQAGYRVLDVACGTGVLAREAARVVGPTGFVAGVDRDAGMLAVAGRAAPDIEWRHGSAESLPYDDRSFAAVVSQFGLMFFSDRNAALREMLRVLVPGGRLAIAVWDTLENTPAYATLVAILERVVGTRAADALRAPFALGDRGELATLCAAAGIADLHAATHTGSARFPSVRTMIEAEVRGWMPAVGIDVSDEQFGDIIAQATQALARFVGTDGVVTFDSPAHIVSGAAPA
jgi:SAM-dependent methyltransferase